MRIRAVVLLAVLALPCPAFALKGRVVDPQGRPLPVLHAGADRIHFLAPGHALIVAASLRNVCRISHGHCEERLNQLDEAISAACFASSVMPGERFRGPVL